MDLECLMGIVGTRRIEPAGRWAAGKGTLIRLDPPQCSTLAPRHVGRLRSLRTVSWCVRTVSWCVRTLRSSSATERSTSANVCSHAGTRAPTRYRPGGTSEFASTARSRRRKRLRDTAEPTARPMANATCGGARSGSRTNEHHSGSARTRTPSRRRRTKASRSRTRSIKRRVGPGPWPGGTSTPHDRRECSCAHGTRACGLGGACWADRYASRLTPDGSRQITFRRRPHRSHSIGCAPHGLTWQGYGHPGTCANRRCQTTPM